MSALQFTIELAALAITAIVLFRLFRSLIRFTRSLSDEQSNRETKIEVAYHVDRQEIEGRDCL